MSNRPARTALVTALGDRRRHLVALALVAAAFGVAAVLASSVAYYAAALIAFAVWMGWFVLTAVDWLDRADF
ncbi:hypothetical protein [Halomarina pelagica]|uniref:hypothetical protein n=1 Tax=Halomarina pelagica TaxID=2961599 RepID=UPI0020C4BEA3|nr:hypothetical protein [Halomarina sp. BND7]